MKVNNGTAAGIMLIIIGALCIIFRSNIIYYASLFIGIALFVYGILELCNDRTTSGILCIIGGLILILLGWFMVAFIFYIIAIALIVIGIVGLVSGGGYTRGGSFFGSPVVRNIIMIVVGALLFINQRAALSAVFIVIGALLLAAGIMVLTESR